MLKKFVRILGGDPNKRALEKYEEIVLQINDLEAQYEELSDDSLRAKTGDFRTRLAGQLRDIDDPDERNQAEQNALAELLPEAFTAVREASKRFLGMRHFDVQLIGGIALHEGKISEMRTGEGKTLVATLPLYLNAITGRGAHLVTVNDYLARRDARWMGPVYAALGLSVGVLQMAARTENGKKAFLFDPERKSPHEDQHQLRMVPRQEAYQADITYGTNSEFGFDYLRDNMTMRLEDRVQRGHYYAIVDEVDNILIDEARTPLIISGPAYDDTSWYSRMDQVVKRLRLEDYEINERDRTITLTEIGEAHVEQLLEMPLRDPERPEDVTPEQARLMGYLEQALRAQFLFKRNKDYLVQSGKVVIIDEFTGRLMPGRRWSDGLHQAVEAKEGVRVQEENVTYATITIQNYFRMYQKLAGMSGTSLTEAEEFDKIYKLGVVAIPTNLEFVASRTDSQIVELEDRDEQGYKYRFYARQGDQDRQPIFWKRKDYPDVIFRTEEAKFRAIATEILSNNSRGRPVLVGTTSVELSERLSARLRAEPLRRLAQTLLIRDAWFEKHPGEMDGRQIPELQPFNAPLDQLQNSDIRKMINELGLSYNPEEPGNVTRLVKIFNLQDEDSGRLVACLKAGIPHQVLNARKHAEESQIIAGAGAFGAVTIATNMAGRGVDIKLGGELAEEILTAVNRILRRAGYDNPYDMLLEERRQALIKLDAREYGIYEAEIRFFLQQMEDMERVKSLGGLHVVGSERHEARRIDNQLRGRSARQGDPGSSRFYLSLEDELMRRFGGQQANDMMQRFKVDDALPMEIGLVGRLVEQSQTRVEGANFDMRKHLLEYDDVLNLQRTKIYTQRDRIFTKADLSDDVTDMLREEIKLRVPAALNDSEGPWKLLAWLDQIQPSITFSNAIYPSYSLRLLTDHLSEPAKVNAQTILDVAAEALQAEQEHLLNSIHLLIEQTGERLESLRRERADTLDTFLEGLKLGDDETSQPRNAREIVEDLSAQLHIPLKLTPEQQRLITKEPDALRNDLRAQVENSVILQSAIRLIGAIQRRLNEEIELNPVQLTLDDWDQTVGQVLSTVETALNRRRERLLGNGASGQIAKDLEAALARLPKPLSPALLLNILLMLPQGTRSTFDKKTHQRVTQRTTRLTYIYSVAKLLENRAPEEVSQQVLEHLEGALQIITNALDNRQAPGGESGSQVLTTIYRQLLLGVITELWVDYLTQMEALRVSIGLEAYAQRDPLVQYKSRAFELFQTLLKDMRMGLVSRMFTYWARYLSASEPVSRRVKEATALEASPADSPIESEETQTITELNPGSDEENDETTEMPASETATHLEAPTQLSKSQRRRRRRR